MKGPGSLALKRRIQRLELIKNLLNDMNGEDFEKATAVIMYNTGLTKQRVAEYLEVLEKIEFFSVENGKVKILAKEQKEQNESDE